MCHGPLVRPQSLDFLQTLSLLLEDICYDKLHRSFSKDCDVVKSDNAWFDRRRKNIKAVFCSIGMTLSASIAGFAALLLFALLIEQHGERMCIAVISTRDKALALWRRLDTRDAHSSDSSLTLTSEISRRQYGSVCYGSVRESRRTAPADH